MWPVRETIARIAGYVPGEQPRDRQYIKLNTNENPYPPSPHVAEALKAFDPARLRLYSEPLSLDLRAAAAAPLGLDAEWAIAGNGSDDLLTIALRTFVDQGGTLAYTVPSYSLYPVLGDLQGAGHAAIELDENFELPADAADRAAGASLFLLARPNAPTGNAFPRDVVHRLCRTFKGIVWIDEAYADFADDDCADFVKLYNHVVVSKTFSKSFSLAGLRLGIAFANPALITEMMKVKDSYNVDMLTQILGKAALEDREYMQANAARIRATRDRVAGQLRDLGFRVLPSQTNFLMAKPPVPAEGFFLALREAGFLVRYFRQPRIRDYIRITIGTEADMSAFVNTAVRLLGRA